MPPSWSRVIQIQAWAIVALILCVFGLSVAVVVLQTRHSELSAKHEATLTALESNDYEMAKLRFIAEKAGAKTKIEYEKAANALIDFMKTYPDAKTYRRLTQ